MAVSVAILSWNIQILGQAKISKDLESNVLAMIISDSGADVVALQEPVYNIANQVGAELIVALRELKQNDWAFHAVQAVPGGRDRDGYLFLWRSGKYKQQQIGGANVAGTFNGDFPTNDSPRNGRRVGYVGLTLADGSHPFIVAAYHAPTKDGAYSAPATGLNAIKTEAGQLKTYNDGGAHNYEARFLCADFNLDINEAGVKAAHYQPAMTATDTANVTTDKTIFLPLDKAPKSQNPADYLANNLDNILAGPAGSVDGAVTFNTINLVQDKRMAQLIGGFHITNELKSWWNPKDAYTCFAFARTYISDHLPILATFTLVP